MKDDTWPWPEVMTITTAEQWLDVRMEAFALALLRYLGLPDADKGLVDSLARRVLVGSAKNAVAARRGIAAVLFGSHGRSP